MSLTNQLSEGYVSPRLRVLCGYYSNRMSYEEVAGLVERVSGVRLLSDQKIGQIVSAKALKLSQEIAKSTTATLVENSSDVVQVNSKVDIYNPQETEILLFDDGVLVKGQKAQRQREAEPGEKSENPLGTKTPAISTDIILWQKATPGFEYIAAPIDATGEDLLDLAKVTKAKVIQEYGNQTFPLNLVAITDGARVIRHRLLTIFGVAVTVIEELVSLEQEIQRDDVNDC